NTLYGDLFDVFLNGVKLNTDSFSFTANQITLLDGSYAGDIIDVVGFSSVTVYATLPSQAGNAGKFLSTDGTSLSWEAVSASGFVPYTGAIANVDLGEYELKAGQVEFDQTPTGAAGVGVMRWNDADGTVDLGLKGGNVTLQVGQEQVQRVVNKSGANLLESAYQVVKVTSAQGQRLAVDLAQGNNDANSTDTLGIVTETINNNQEGFITTSGLINEINTTGSLQGETWVDGDVLYLSPTIAGAITTVKPTAPDHTVILGYVVYAHAIHGKIFVKCDNGYELGELHNVFAPTPSNNDGIFWNTANSRYQNNSIAGALGYTPISGSGVTGQVAYWNGTNSQTGSNNLFWDAANSRLGIGTNAPISKLHIIGSSTFAGNATFTGVYPYFELKPSDWGTNYFYLQSGVSVNGATAGNYTTFFNYLGTSRGFSFVQGSNVSMVISPTTYNVLLGGTTDGGQRLQVYGDAFIKGSADTFGTSGLTIQNNSGSSLFRVLNNGMLRIGSTSSNPLIFPQTNSGTAETISGTNLSFYSYTGSQSASSGRFFFGGENMTQASGANYNIFSAGKFFPASGTATFADIIINPQISQTGGANGITRGLYVNPTLTAAADWRSIEWSNNSGWGLYGAGTANNYLAGRLLIKTSTIGTFDLDVNGTARVSGNMAIGTTLSTWGAGTFALEIGQGTSLWNPGG
ncbi:MAG: hypothetical protein ACRCW1_04160, partial [Anaerotignaceae bacterium]